MGRVRNYAIGNVLARYMRTRGKNVLHPMDGTPSAGERRTPRCRTRKVPARDWTYANIANMKKQLKAIGLSFDWTRELATCEAWPAATSGESCSSISLPPGW